MRVLLVHTQMNYFGGAELLVAELSNYLTKKRIKNDILALSTGENAENKLLNKQKTKIIIPKHGINLRPPGFHNIKDVLNFIEIYRREIKKIGKNYDIINFHNFPVTWTLWPKKKPCVWMLNEPPSLWSKPDANFIFKIIDKLRNIIDRFIVNKSVDIICVSDEFNKKRTIKRYGKKWVGKIRKVNYGIDYGFFSKGKKTKARKKYKLKNKFIIIQSGMFNEQKNQLTSVKVVEKLKEKIPNILIIFAGSYDTKYGKKVREYIKEKNLEKNILMTGNVKREDLRDLYAASNIGFVPIKSQGGWLAPFELLCLGKPIVFSPEITCAKMIKENKLGIITDDYFSAILNIYENKTKYNKQAKKASLFIKNNLSWEKFGGKLERAFKDAIKMHKTR